MSGVSHALRERFSSFGPEYRQGLSNHLPMALVALEKMGASDAELAGFFESYTPRLEAGPGQLAPDDARVYLQALEDNRAAIARLGASVVLRDQLPALGPGIGAAAFHAMLRTAYGVEAGNDEEIAAGLAYWRMRFLALTAMRPAKGHLDMRQWLARLRTLPAPMGDFNLIFQRMQAFADMPAVHLALQGLDVAALSLHDLSRVAASEYARHEDFTVLHLITSSHAMRILMPFSDQPSKLLHDYAIAFGVAYALSVADHDVPVLAYETLPFPAIEARARASNNDHTVKLVYSCGALQDIDPELFRRAASAAVREH